MVGNGTSAALNSQAPPDFVGRRALVTGAGSGIGRAIALRLAAGGCSVACLDIDLAAANQVAVEIREAGAIAEAEAVDVSHPEQVERAVGAAADALGGVDVLVNNAGIVAIRSFEETSLEEWDRTMGVNLRSLFLMCQAALPSLKASSSPAIVNIASMAAFRYTVPHVDYAATKGGVVSFTRDLAFELGGAGIRVNAVAPGPTATAMMGRITDEQLSAAGMRFLLGRIGRPEDIAEAVAFLASDRAAYVTGTTLPVTGGAELATRPFRAEDG